MEWRVCGPPTFYYLSNIVRWSAIVYGAVLRGLEGSIVDTKFCRRHYGHSMSKKYDPLTDWNYDANKRQVWKDVFDGEEMLSGAMVWEMSKV